MKAKIKYKDSESEYVPTEEVTQEPVELSEGQEVLINGAKFIYSHGGFKLPEEDKKNEKQFLLYFKDFGQDVVKKEVDGCPIERRGKYLVVDIYPLLEKALGDQVQFAQYNLTGVQQTWGGGSAVEDVVLSLSRHERDEIKKKFERMFDMAVVNQNQLKGFKSYMDEVFTELWRSFYRDF